MDKTKLRGQIVNGICEGIMSVSTVGLGTVCTFQAVDRFKAKDKKGGVLSIAEGVLGLTLCGLMIYDNHRKVKK
jgi:hypothetical protein